MSIIKSKKTPKSAAVLFFTILIGIALNILGSKLNGALGLPLFFDNTGTLLAAMTGGYLPCITVGFFTNILSGIGNPSTMYYCIISVLIAVAAVYCDRKGLLRRLSRIFLAVLMFAFIGGVVGGALTWLINGMSFGEGYAVELAESINASVPMGYFASNLLSCFAVDIVDKAVVTAAAVLIFRLLPKRLVTDIKSHSWYLRENEAGSLKDLYRGFPLSMKASLVVSLSITLVASSAIAISVLQYHGSTVDEYEQKGSSAATILGNMLSADRVDDLLTHGRSANGYYMMTNVLSKISEASPEIKFFYAYRVTEEGSLVVFDMDTAEVAGNEIGSVIEYDSTIEKYRDLFLEGKDIPADITSDEYGWLMSVYNPVRDRSGNLLCYSIVDMSMDKLRSDETAFLTKVISLFVGILLLIRAYAVWLTQSYIVRPMNTIADTVNRFSYDTPEAREESMKMVESLDIQTGDEIENLYNAYKRTTSDMVRYIDEVQHKSNQIANLQNGLILVLADMVENRDQNTGDHVKKTAAYVAIILEQMKKDDIYSDMLTDQFVYDAVHSAPLHDVGKIKVSDTILNKPGKLTDEEFAVMKSHTTSGMEIIDMVIDTVAEESDYLEEARNLAAYHHEKWDGSGYPKGLKGEEIPLSARIMAVADVFDALVSRRSYKEPFTIEKAIDIIREGSGKHFDPLVVEAFLNAESEIRRVANMNMQNYDYKQHNL